MALPILDGNQSATTLSTILSSGQHITAHTVVSLGTQAITDIVNATSAGLTNTQLRASAVTVGGTVTVGNSLAISSLPAIGGTVTANLGDGLVSSNLNAVDQTKCAAVQIFDEDGNIKGGTSGLSVNPIGLGAALADYALNQGVTDPLPISGTVTIGNTVTIAGTVTANPTGTQTIAGTVTANVGITSESDITQFGEWIANGFNAAQPTISVIGSSAGQPFPISGTVTANVLSQDIYDASNTSYLTRVALHRSLGSGEWQEVGGNGGLENPLPISGTVTIGSLPAISGTVTANTFAVQGTAVTTSNFTSTTASTVLANYNATREVLTIFNEGAGNLHICAGATCTTIAYQVRLSAGDYYEVPNHQTTITHSAVFATAGTARICEVS